MAEKPKVPEKAHLGTSQHPKEEGKEKKKVSYLGDHMAAVSSVGSLVLFSIIKFDLISFLHVHVHSYTI